MKLTPEQISQYDRDGYLHFPELFSPQEVEALRREGGMLGAEQSGHVIALDGHVTGDGLAAALLLCRSLAGRSLAELRDYPAQWERPLFDREGDVETLLLSLLLIIVLGLAGTWRTLNLSPSGVLRNR